MNVRVDLQETIYDGMEVKFRSPVDCSQVTGLKLFYPENDITTSQEFAFADAHGNNVGDIDHLFAENVVVKVILDLNTNMAFVQNADTNAYLEGRFAELEGKIGTGGGGVANINYNLATMEDAEWGYIATDGTIYNTYGSTEQEKSSGYIPVTAGEKYTFQCWVDLGTSGTMWMAYAFYDSDKKMVGTRVVHKIVKDVADSISHASITFTAPTNAVCCRISGRTYGNGQFKLEWGDVPTAYVPNGNADKLGVLSIVPYPLTYATIIPSIQTNELPIVDTVAKTLYIPADTLICDHRIPTAYKYVALAKQTYTFTSAGSAVGIFYDIQTGQLVSYKHTGVGTIDTSRYLLLCTVRTDSLGYGYGKVTSTCPMIVDGRLFGVIDIEKANADTPEVGESAVNNSNPFIRSINHRGYNTEAPENTLAAFKLSKKKGFDYVECDISFTSDNVPVLLHDNTINRTARNADGTALTETINIVSITLEQAKTYDFGLWKSEAYAGEKIPTFEEFIILCKRIGLKPYIDLKTVPGNWQMSTMASILKRYGMAKDASWVAYNRAALEKVLTAIPYARIGLLTTTTTDDDIVWIENTRTSENEIFLDTDYQYLTAERIESCVAKDIPIEVYTIKQEATIKALDSYISGYTSESLIANHVLYDDTVK